MADKTGIEWTDASWNPVVGCSIVSPGCTNCYAMGQAARIIRCAAGSGRPTHYEGTVREVKGKPVWTGTLALALESILLQPLRWRRGRKIFVNSMGDIFHEDAPDAWIDRVFAVMALSPQHTYQVLTKRAARMRAYLTNPRTAGAIARVLLDAVIEGSVPASDMTKASWPVVSIGADIDEPDDVVLHRWPLPNVWLGVSAEDQARADERVPELLATPAAVRFVSAEPLLGPIDFGAVQWAEHKDDRRNWFIDGLRGRFCSDAGDGGPFSPKLDWIIVGGESGSGARPMHPDWARSIRDQCVAAGTAFFFKQWGEWQADDMPSEIAEDLELRDRYAVIGSQQFARVGKARAGRLLDGVEHNAMPALRS